LSGNKITLRISDGLYDFTALPQQRYIDYSVNRTIPIDNSFEVKRKEYQRKIKSDINKTFYGESLDRRAF